MQRRTYDFDDKGPLEGLTAGLGVKDGDRLVDGDMVRPQVKTVGLQAFAVLLKQGLEK